MDLGQVQAQEREFYDTLHSPCISSLSPACILRKTSIKGTNNADIFSRWLTRFLCRSSGLSSHLSDSVLCLASIFSCLFLLTVLSGRLPQANCYTLPSVVNYLSPFSFVHWPYVFSGTRLFSSTSGLELKPFVWVSWQNRQRDRLTGAYTHTQLNSHIVSHYWKPYAYSLSK